jgi:hypothetical protein
MFHESNEVMKRVFETDDIYIWGFLVVSLGGLLILVGQGTIRLLRRLTGRLPRDPQHPTSSPRSTRKS